MISSEINITWVALKLLIRKSYSITFLWFAMLNCHVYWQTTHGLHIIDFFVCVKLLSMVFEVDSMVLSSSMYQWVVPVLTAACASGVISTAVQRLPRPKSQTSGQIIGLFGSLNFTGASCYSVLLINPQLMESCYKTVWICWHSFPLLFKYFFF